jgi:hypothetical protein
MSDTVSAKSPEICFQKVRTWKVATKGGGGIVVDVDGEDDVHARGPQASACSAASGEEVEDLYLQLIDSIYSCLEFATLYCGSTQKILTNPACYTTFALRSNAATMRRMVLGRRSSHSRIRRTDQPQRRSLAETL